LVTAVQRARVRLEAIERSYAMRAPVERVRQHQQRLDDLAARMALATLQLKADCPPAPRHILDKHYLRKHGPDAYYGQDKDHKA